MQSEKTLLAAIEEQESLATGSGILGEERRDALDHYLGRPYGDEEDGRSQVVMRDVADTIEWIKPSLLKIFCAGEEVARFDPVGPEDEKQAEQETDYINHIIQTKNNGFLVFHDWFHDALLQKNGYVWAQVVEEERQTRQSYENLTDDEFALILQNQELQIIEHAEGAVMGPTGPYRTHSCVLVERRPYPCIKIRNVPPERVAVSSDWPGVNFDGCPFVRIVEYPTISELRNAGYDVQDDINDNGGNEQDKYDEERRNLDLEDVDERDQGADAATRRVRTRYIWMNYDEDGDGIAELRHIVLVGSKFLENEEADLNPVAALTPGRLPHEHIGLSIDDLVADLQRIRTTLMRGFLDNMYLANNGRNIIDSTTVNLDDLLTVRPGGVVRNKGPVNTAIAPLVHPQVGQDIMAAVQYVDTVREDRTGVTRYSQGLDVNALNNQTATATNSLDNASRQRIELIARMFAETGVRQLMLIVHALSLKNTRQSELIKLRNEWIPVDPSSWKTRYDVTVTVGIGTGSKDQQASHLFNIWQAQMAGLQFGIATPQNLYVTATKMTQNAGFRQPEMFWTDPSKQPPAPPQPSPEEIKAQAEAQKIQFQEQSKKELKQMELVDSQQKFQAEQQTQMGIDANRQEWEARQKQLELTQEGQLERMRAEYEARLNAQELSFERWKVVFTEQNKRELAQMQMAKEMAQHRDNMNQNELNAQREDARQKDTE